MADVPVYSVFAFCKDETGGEYRRLAPLWRLEDTVRHAAHRGFDTILVELVRRRGIVWRLRLLGTTVSRRYWWQGRPSFRFGGAGAFFVPRWPDLLRLVAIRRFLRLRICERKKSFVRGGQRPSYSPTTGGGRTDV
jgi:hypothetical protein